jgi:hypothetical protein
MLENLKIKKFFWWLDEKEDSAILKEKLGKIFLKKSHIMHEFLRMAKIFC